MLTRKFGKLDFQVSCVGFGGAAVSGSGGGYGFGDISDQESTNLLHAALDHGINLFDTAPAYGYGQSEKNIGRAFKTRRDDVFIVSKSGVTWDHTKTLGVDNNPKLTQKMLEQSLRDLNTDYIDLYMIHWPDSKVDIRKPMEVLSRAKSQGKIKAIGLCNSNSGDIYAALEIDRVDVLQNNMNSYMQSVVKNLFDIVRNEEMGFMAYGTFDKGILTGRVVQDRTYEKADLRSWSESFKKELKDWKFEVVERLKALAKRENTSLVSLALGGVLQHPEASTALCGVRSVEQLQTTIQALENLPPQSVLDEANKIIKEEQAK